MCANADGVSPVNIQAPLQLPMVQQIALSILVSTQGTNLKQTHLVYVDSYQSLLLLLHQGQEGDVLCKWSVAAAPLCIWNVWHKMQVQISVIQQSVKFKRIALVLALEHLFTMTNVESCVATTTVFLLQQMARQSFPSVLLWIFVVNVVVMVQSVQDVMGCQTQG